MQRVAPGLARLVPTIDVLATSPLTRAAETAEITNVILFLASNLNTYMTAQNVVIDGGFVNV